MGVGDHRQPSAALPSGNRLCARCTEDWMGPQGRSGWVRKISPPKGFDPGPSCPSRVAILTMLSRYPGILRARATTQTGHVLRAVKSQGTNALNNCVSTYKALLLASGSQCQCFFTVLVRVQEGCLRNTAVLHRLLLP